MQQFSTVKHIYCLEDLPIYCSERTWERLSQRRHKGVQDHLASLRCTGAPRAALSPDAPRLRFSVRSCMISICLFGVVAVLHMYRCCLSSIQRIDHALMQDLYIHIYIYTLINGEQGRPYMAPSNLIFNSCICVGFRCSCQFICMPKSLREAFCEELPFRQCRTAMAAEY